MSHLSPVNQKCRRISVSKSFCQAEFPFSKGSNDPPWLRERRNNCNNSRLQLPFPRKSWEWIRIYTNLWPKHFFKSLLLPIRLVNKLHKYFWVIFRPAWHFFVGNSRLDSAHSWKNPPKTSPKSWGSGTRWTLGSLFHPQGFWDFARKSIDFRRAKKHHPNIRKQR